MFGLTKQEEKILRRLDTPIKIQDYLDRLPINHEKQGDTHYSPRMVLQKQKAHCIEGALLAAVAFWIQGKPPLLLDLKTKQNDDEHVVALFKQNGYWGAISKTNHSVLCFRDPIYKTVRELAVSYYHEYFRTSDGLKTLVSYSRPFDLRNLGEAWVTSEEHLWYLDDRLNATQHYALVPKENRRYLRNATAFACLVQKTQEWKKSNPKT